MKEVRLQNSPNFLVLNTRELSNTRSGTRLKIESDATLYRFLY